MGDRVRKAEARVLPPAVANLLAISHYTKAISLDDQAADYHCNLGTALRNAGAKIDLEDLR